MDVAESGMKLSWLDVTSAAATAIMQLSAGPGLASHSALPCCLSLIESLSTSYPLKVLAAVQRMPLFILSESASCILSGEAHLKAAIPLSDLSAFNAEMGSSEYTREHTDRVSLSLTQAPE